MTACSPDIRHNICPHSAAYLASALGPDEQENSAKEVYHPRTMPSLRLSIQASSGADRVRREQITILDLTMSYSLNS